MTSYRSVRLTFLSLLTLVMFRCAGQVSVSDPLDLVPAGAAAVVAMRWPEVTLHPAFRSISELPELARAFADLQLSPDELQEVVVFSTTVSAKTAGEEKILSAPRLGERFAAAAKNRGWTPTSQDGVTVYQAQDTRTEGAAITNHLVVLGSPEGVRAVLESRRPRAGTFLARPELGPLAEFFSTHDPVVIAIVWPTDAQDVSTFIRATSAGLLNMAGLERVGSIVEKLGIGRAFAMRLRHASPSMHVTVASAMEDETTASLVAGSLKVLQGLNNLMPPDVRRGADGPNLSSMKVDRNGAVVSIALSIPEDQWR